MNWLVGWSGRNISVLGKETVKSVGLSKMVFPLLGLILLSLVLVFKVRFSAMKPDFV